MTAYVISAPELITLPVVGSDGVFPVRRIYCVGRNYAAHTREMGGHERDLPFFFQKPRDTVVLSGGTVPYPTLTEDLQHEIELVLALGLGGSHIAQADAAQHVFGLAVGMDLTRRDVQGQAKKAGRPWEIGKAFDHSAPVTAISPLNGAALPDRGRIALSVNGEVRQQGDLAEMIWSCAEVISILSTHYALLPGDLIYTGTPAGVGPVLPGDELTGVVEGLPNLLISIGEK